MACLVCAACLGTLLTSYAVAADIEKWKQFRFEMSAANWQGSNPFVDVQLTGTFKHVPSGATFSQPGFYAGSNTWKIYFMPHLQGEWTFTTASNTAELNGKTGTFNCVASSLKGSIQPSGLRWKYSDGGYVYPIMTSSSFYYRGTELGGGISDFIDWVDQTMHGKFIHPAQLYYFKADGKFVKSQSDLAFESGKQPDWLNPAFFERLNGHLDYLRDRNMGMYVMFFSDDAHSPDANGVQENSDGSLSEVEKRLYRYAIARFAAYPNIIWDSGIDVGEYRDDNGQGDKWYKAFVNYIIATDPWDHPVSSRTGGGSKGVFPPNATYFSDGIINPTSYPDYVQTWQSRSVPTAFTDRFREDYSRGNYNRTKLRQTIWQAGLTGGSVTLVSGKDNSGYLGSSYQSDLEAAPDIGYAVGFFENIVVNFDSLDPAASLADDNTKNWAAAAPGSEYVVYLSPGNANKVTLNLSAAAGTTFHVYWYDPLDGKLTAAADVSGGGNPLFNTPGNNSGGQNDWALYLRATDLPTIPGSPPAQPKNVQVDIIRK